MKTLFTSLLFLLIFSVFTPAGFSQNAGKAMKALNDKNFGEAQKLFADLVILDENDIAGNYGLSRVYSAPASGVKDNNLSLECLVKAEITYKSTDSKTIAKLDAIGVTQLALSEQRTNLERAFLEETKKTGTVEAFDAFIEKFPSSAVIAAAVNNRNAVAYIKAKALNTVESFDDFITKYPKAAETNEAKDTRNQLATAVALNLNTVAGYKNFLQKYPDAPQVPQIQQRANAAAFEEATKINTIEIWEDYVRNYPDSIFLQKAKQRLEELKWGE